MHLKPVERDNLSSRVYRQLRAALMGGLYEPGHRFNILEIAKETGTSATPVREAIFRLAADGALEIQSAQSICVPRLQPSELLEIQTIRCLLEGEAAAAATLLVTADEIETLAALNDRFIYYLTKQNLEEASALNRDFHFSILEIASMPQLRNLVEGMWVRMGAVIRQVNLSIHRQGLTTGHDHYALITAFRDHAPEAARAAIGRDIRSGRLVALETWGDSISASQ